MNNHLCFVDWICNNALVLSEDQCDRKKVGKQNQRLAEEPATWRLQKQKLDKEDLNWGERGVKQSFRRYCISENSNSN